jgi:hypothetical protein
MRKIDRDRLMFITQLRYENVNIKHTNVFKIILISREREELVDNVKKLSKHLFFNIDTVSDNRRIKNYYFKCE